MKFSQPSANALVHARPNPLADFLKSSKLRLEQILTDLQNSEIIHFVMGNESADLDSIASSIAYAYLLSRDKSELYVPLMNIGREEIILRKDVLFLFQLLNISLADVLFLNDNFHLETLHAQNRLRFNLVDHNVLSPKQLAWSNAVESIVDHHLDKNIHYPLVVKEDRLIAVVGSSATLIAERILVSHKIAIYPELATLLLGPILIDTWNLKSVEKTTERDIQIALILERMASNFLPGEYYERLLAAKNDLSGLTPLLLLTKDFKEYLDGDVLYGISSLPLTQHWGVEDLEAVGPVIQKFARDNHLAFLIVLMNSGHVSFKREMLVYSSSKKLLKVFEAYMLTNSVLAQIGRHKADSEKFQISIYGIYKPIARKQLQPLFNFSQIFPHFAG